MPAAQHSSRAFPAELGSVAAARQFVREALAELPEEACYAVALVVSELATNALLHAATGFEVNVHRDGTIRLAVIDGDPAPPVRREVSPTDTSGRGLHLIEHLCTRWGVERVGGGKAVWCEVDLTNA
jgi:anti-sigma regulatory factor (Ser/Thr protein kinase)